jgi:hypothetical protein
VALPAGFSRGQKAEKPLKGVCICPVPLFQVKLRDFATSPHSNEIGKQFSELRIQFFTITKNNNHLQTDKYTNSLMFHDQFLRVFGLTSTSSRLTTSPTSSTQVLK